MQKHPLEFVRSAQQLRWNNGTRLSSGDWERVVAVFAQGAAWQFKGWKREAPVDIFSRSLGVHLMYDDERPSKNVMAWNVRILKISKSKRHLDKPVHLDFWRQLDEFVRVHNPSYAAELIAKFD